MQQHEHSTLYKTRSFLMKFTQANSQNYPKLQVKFKQVNSQNYPKFQVEFKQAKSQCSRREAAGTDWPGRTAMDRASASPSSGCDEMSWGRGIFIENNNQSVSGWWQPVCRRMRGGTSYSTWLAACLSLMQVNTPPPTCQDACLECMQDATQVHTCRSACFGCMRRDTSCLVDPPRVPHVISYATASCTDTPQASVDTKLAGLLTPRSDPMQRATSSFSVHSSDFGPSSNFLIRDKLRIFCSHSDEFNIFNKLQSEFRGKLRAEETSFFQNVELRNRRASKNVLLPRHLSDQFKTSSKYGRTTYSTH
ncbi:hypothetical protein IGI04_020211, partial [Brassica rapa subsp. trilocularis]